MCTTNHACPGVALVREVLPPAQPLTRRCGSPPLTFPANLPPRGVPAMLVLPPATSAATLAVRPLLPSEGKVLGLRPLLLDKGNVLTRWRLLLRLRPFSVSSRVRSPTSGLSSKARARFRRVLDVWPLFSWLLSLQHDERDPLVATLFPLARLARWKGDMRVTRRVPSSRQDGQVAQSKGVGRRE